MKADFLFLFQISTILSYLCEGLYINHLKSTCKYIFKCEYITYVNTVSVNPAN